MDRCVFVHANPRQALGATVASYSLRRNSRHPERFDVAILSTEHVPVLREYEGRAYRFGGRRRLWRNDDLQSFTPLRFAPPERMGYRGRAIVIDPDIFALGHINELLDRDMRGKLLHNTRRRTQPWTTAFPVDFRINAPLCGVIPRSWIRRVRAQSSPLDVYKPHPDPRQEAVFFGLLRECLAAGIVDEERLRHEIRSDYLRHDAFEVLDRVPSLRDQAPSGHHSKRGNCSRRV